MVERSVRTPRSVWAIIVVLALLQPLLHFLTRYAPPADTVSTGLHIPDSALFIHAMDMFTSGFHSAYATCQGTVGAASVTYYSVPHLWLYGALGLMARVLPVDPFMIYGVANGLGALIYLWIVFRLLLLIAPRIAVSAFVLFALSGGPGGLLYLLSTLTGFERGPEFDAYFFRFAVYDLMEGPHFNPVLYFPRLYYTLSLACCLGGMGASIRHIGTRKAALSWPWMLAIFVGSFLDARYTVFTFGLLLLYVGCQGQVKEKNNYRALLAYGLPGGAGLLLAGALMRTNPTVIQNHLAVGSMAMWFSPFVLVTWLHWLVARSVILRRETSLPVRLAISAGCGYLAAYAAGYLLYQAYFGNLLSGRDGSVAAAVSDGALVGAVAGLGWAYFAPKHGANTLRTREDALLDWIVLWLLGFTALALSGFGRGWFLQFGPQRLQVFIWLPLCIVAAMGLAAMTPGRRRMAWCVLLTCGMSSVAVAAFAFQSPLGRIQAKGTYPGLHPEIIHHNDAALIAELGDGTVMAPTPAGDVVVRMKGNPVVFGIGSFNLTDQPYGALKTVADTFFDAATTNEMRRALAERWCVEWVYCSFTWPVDAKVREQLKHAPWLKLVAEEGTGLLMNVRGTEE